MKDNTYVLISDSCSDMTPEMVEETDAKIVPMIFRIDENDYLDYPDDREMSSHDFYEKLRNGKRSQTSQITPSRYIDFIEPFLKEGKDVLLVVFSSALSNTYASAMLAVNTLKEKYPTRIIDTIDSLSAAGGQGYFVYMLGLNRNNGMNIEENRKWGEDNKLHVAHWFTIDDLMYLKRGGRLSASKAWMGTLLTLKPILHVDDQGRLVPMETVRGRKQAVIALMKHFDKTAYDPSKNVVMIAHADDAATAHFLGNKLQAKYDIPKLIYGNIGPVIGSHTGSNAILLFFMAKHR